MTSLELITLILIILGLVAGLLAGLLGIGGGILFTPILFVIFKDAGVQNPVVMTIATSLFCTFIAAGSSSARQFRQRNFFLKEGLMVGFLGAVGVTLGKWVITADYYSQQAFATIFTILLFFVAAMFFRRGRSTVEQVVTDDTEVRSMQAVVTGALGGFIAALAGIGGGGVMVPILNLGYRKSFKKAVSISSLAIVVISLAGWIQLVEFVDFGAALPLAAGGLAGGFAGAWLNLAIDRRHLQVAFALLAIAMAVKLLTEVY